MTRSKPDKKNTAAGASAEKPKAVSKAKPPRPGEAASDSVPPREVGGRDGPEPTRFGDWEKNGRCVDF